MQPPKTHYARNRSGEYVAYQTLGGGPVDLVFVPDWVSNLEIMWEQPTVRRFLERLASFCRLICFDKRGCGISDPVTLSALPTYEEWTDDIGTVLDRMGLESAWLLGHGDGGHMAILFAATHPARTQGLILFDTYARRTEAPDYPCGVPEKYVRLYINAVMDAWGKGTITRVGGAPSLSDDEAFIDWRGRYERLSMTPGMFEKTYPTTYEIDVRSALATIRVPTLVLHRKGNSYIRVDNGRFLAEHIEGARFVELDGNDHFFHAGDTEPALAEVEQFLTGAATQPEEHRILATVLFTDIVDATTRAQAVGDKAWKALLERHHELVRGALRQHRGQEVDTAGDGFFATFDGPARGVRCALAIREALEAIGLQVRIGLHVGECEMIGPKVGGIAVHIGARVMAEAVAGEVLVSRTVKDLVVGSGLRFTPIGARSLKGIEGEWELFRSDD
jgi:pimeloyl-ACP methyl ester carboxylesterase